jgi:hypothetical protein
MIALLAVSRCQPPLAVVDMYRSGLLASEPGPSPAHRAGLNHSRPSNLDRRERLRNGQPERFQVNDRFDLRRMSPSFSRMVEKPLDGRDKVFHLDWLALVRVKSCVRDPPPILGHHGRGHGHDGNPSSGLLGSQLS